MPCDSPATVASAGAFRITDSWQIRYAPTLPWRGEGERKG